MRMKQQVRSALAGSSCRVVLTVSLLLAVASIPTRDLIAANLEIRVADETAPPGGIALIRIELTEPKPVSGGQMRFFYAIPGFQAPAAHREAAGPLGPVLAGGLLSRTGDVSGHVSLGTDDVTFQFNSPRSSFGTEDDLPIMVVAIPVTPGAVPGTSVSLQLDLGASRFLDPDGVPYTVDVKPGRFTVGGVSINKIAVPDWTVPAGSNLVLNGTGFQPGVRADIEGADLSATRFVSPQRVEATARLDFNLDGARVRVRNPDNSEDVFYAIPALVESDRNQGVSVRFQHSGLRLLRGQAGQVTVQLDPAPAADGALRLQSSDPAVLQAPATVPVRQGVSSIGFSVFGAMAGTAELTASLAGPSAVLPVSVEEGTLLHIPVLRNDLSSLMGLAIANHGDVTADLQLRGFPSSPEAVEPVTFSFSLPPFRQVSRFLTEMDPRFQGFRGWLELASSSRNVHALFLNMPGDRVAFAGSCGSSAASKDIIFPASSLDPDGSSELSLVNNNFREALLSLDLKSAAGGDLGRVQQILAPQESLVALQRTLFPDDTGTGPDRYVRVTSSQPLSAYQQTSGGGRIFGRSPPDAERASGRLHLPQFASGANWFTEISLVNAGATETEVVLRLLDDEGVGAVQDVRVNPARLVLPAGGMRVVQGRDLFGISGPRLVVGSVIAESPSPIVGSALVGEGGERKVVTGIPMSAQLFSEAVFPHLATGTVGGVGYFTGLALQNANPQAATALIRVYSRSGELQGELSVTLPGYGRASRLLTEWMPFLAGQVGGHVHVVSTAPIGMIQIYGNDRLEFITAVPPSVIR